MSSLTVEEAVQEILSYTAVISDIEIKDLRDVSGRILAEDMKAEFDNPPFDRSPVDGYACRAADTEHASKEKPVVLNVTEEIDAGQYSEQVIESGQAVRIMTGAAVPAGCDCCIRQEDTDYGEDRVRIYRPYHTMENYCHQGEDFRKGTVLLRKHTQLGFVEMGVLAGMGIRQVPVYRRPRITLLTSGDEVVEPGMPLQPGKIYNSNQTLLLARLQDFGVDIIYVDAVPDSEEAMAEALLSAARNSDFIVTTGGVSVGKKDIMHGALIKAGAERIFWRIQMKPGMPTLFSVLNGIPVLSLSGNPFGVAVTAELLIRPAFSRMMHKASLKLMRKTGVMQNDFSKEIRGRRFIRAYYEDGRIYLPDGMEANGVLASMIGCNCLIERTALDGPLRKGSTASVVCL